MTTNTVAIYAAYREWVYRESITRHSKPTMWSIWLAATLAERLRKDQEKKKNNGR